MKKKIIITSVFLLTLILTSAFMINDKNSIEDQGSSEPAPYFNVRVYQYGGTTVQPNARVDYKQGGTTMATGLTTGDGVYYTSLASGTYDIYVYYPDRPNDSSSGSLIGHYHNTDETVNVTLTVFY